MEKRDIRSIMRALHRDLGFFAIGLVVLFSLSGIVLVFRSTDFLKTEVSIEKQLKPGLSAQEVSSELRLRDFKLESEDETGLKFATGEYNKGSGVVEYRSKELIAPFNQFTKLHKATTQQGFTYLAVVVFGVILLFLAISSFWMFNPRSKHFKRGIYLMLAGVAVSALLLLL